MRKSKLSAAEIEAEEEREYLRAEKRNAAYYFGKNVRDRGWSKLHDLRGADVTMVWGVKDELAQDNKFKLLVNGKELILDADEVRKCIRWV